MSGLEGAVGYSGAGGGDEAFEQRMRLVGLALEFGVELAAEEEGMGRHFDEFDQFVVG
jgi:hypothetical protein